MAQPGGNGSRQSGMRRFGYHQVAVSSGACIEESRRGAILDKQASSNLAATHPNTGENMAQRHKHAEVIKAWADGEKIQYHDTKEWVDCPVNPSFSAWIDYRVKPETLRYRVALLKHTSGYSITSTDDQGLVAFYQGAPSFVRWLTDWIEVEVG